MTRATSAATPHVALVTGGSRGIGRAIAEALAAAGVRVAVAARTESVLAETAGALERTGVRVAALVLDVTDPGAISRAVDEARRALGPVDVLVNNAGIAESAPIGRADLDHWERHLRTNVTGPFLLTRAVLPDMLAGGWGRVVNVASLAGLHGAPYVSAYTASKHALVGLTRAVAAVEVAGKGVTVNALCPGYVATDMTRASARNVAARTGRTYEEAVQALARMNPGGRLVAPEDVAAAAIALLDDDATNGAAIVLDGRERPAVK